MTLGLTLVVTYKGKTQIGTSDNWLDDLIPLPLMEKTLTDLPKIQQITPMELNLLGNNLTVTTKGKTQMSTYGNWLNDWIPLSLM